MAGKKVVALGVAACLCSWAATANAGTYQMHGNKVSGKAVVNVTTPTQPPGGVQTGGVVFTEDWERFNVGEQVHGQDGWKGWDNSQNAGALVTDAQNHTDGGDRSIDINGGSDLVHQFAQQLGATQNSGQWQIRVWQYVPSDMTGVSYHIWQNVYNDGGPYAWTVQVMLDAANQKIIADFRGEELALITDEWVEWVIDVDLDTDIKETGNQTVTYGGQTLYADQPWACGTQPADDCGDVAIGSIDMFANNASSVYYDDITIEHMPRIIGACCNDAEETCTEDDHFGNCPVGRFVRGGTCDAFEPACGDYNDECVAAIAIGADDQFTETSLGATFTFDDFPQCFNGGDQGTRTLWFKFTATNNSTRVRTCPSPVEGGAEDTIVSVFPSGPNGECLDFEPDIGCSDDACGQPAGLHAEVCVATTPGDVYYVMVGNKPGSAPGLFTIETSSFDQCPAPTQGACCATTQTDGSEFCFDQSSGDCFGLSGFYSGDDTRCADDNCPPCNPECPEGQTPEGGFCGFDGADNNSGCNGDGNPEDFTAIEIDEVVCGLGSANLGTRDTDWMSVELEAGVSYQFRVNHGFPALVGFAGYNDGQEGSGDCADGSGFISPGGNMAPGESIVAFTPVATGTYFPYVAVSANGGNFNYVPCCSGTNGYSAVVELAASGCGRDPVWVCDGDTDGDGQVNPVDSGLIQANFGATDEALLCQYDVDCDGQINPVDSGIVQSLFGTCEAPRAECP